MTKASKSHQKPRIVIDSNVWISGLVYGGFPGEVLDLFIKGELLVIVSEELLSELRRALMQKFPLYIPKLNLLEASIRKDALLVGLGSQTVTASRDPDDNKVIETALIGRCDYIISGDKDLLTLESYQTITITSPAGFLKRSHLNK